MLAHSSELPSVPILLLQLNILNKSLLICRREDGVVNGFFNVCRHRGATVEDEKSGCKRRFTCKYHAWNYSNDGKLSSLPGSQCFPSVKVGERNLISVPIIEAYGFVWLMPEQESTRKHLDQFLCDLKSDISDLNLESFTIFGYEDQVWDTNWKLVVEGTLEGYHFPYLHRTSAHAVFEESCVLFDRFGPHLRTFLPKRSLRLIKGQPLDDIVLTEKGNVIYTIFPHETVLHQSDHFLWITPQPISPEKTLVKLRLLIPKNKCSDEEMIEWEENRKFTYQVQYEDLEIYESIQKGFSSNITEEVIFGMQEDALHAYADNIDSSIS